MPGIWRVPDAITEPMLLEYRRWLEAMQKADVPAQEGRIRVWLSKLLFGLSGNYSEDMIRGKIGAFAFALEDKPAFCFDDAVLRRAQRHFKSFWPSAGELIEFMDGIEAEIRVKAKRAWEAIDTGARRADPGRGARMDADAAIDRHREKQRRENAELAAAIGHVPPEMPPRPPGMSDRDYGCMLGDIAQQICRDGERALRRDQAEQARRRLNEARTVLTGEPMVKRERVDSNSANSCQSDHNPGVGGGCAVQDGAGVSEQ